MQLCGFNVGLQHRFFLIAGTCSIEGLEMSLDVAGQLKEACTALGIPLIYKGSFDKANRSSGTSKRGVGLEAGLKILDEVRRQLQLPILTDVHDTSHVAEVASVVDVLQTPAFLCRQTDFIRAVAQSGKPVNIKKGQFLAPWDMKNVIDKARSAAAVAAATTPCAYGLAIEVRAAMDPLPPVTLAIFRWLRRVSRSGSSDTTWKPRFSM